ncbi:50S ribosomal protein L9 [Buchnera aphidicola]|uniref:50S ribosomal protein L9 n=1 Tax=Buchnera aphidicola TaxID=9 RepID=UPI003464BAFF
MEIILLKHFKNLGQFGKIVKVSAGYARNYLIPNEIALLCTKSNLKKFQDLQRKKIEKNKKEIINAQLRIYKIKKILPVVIFSKSGKKNKLFGSINAKDISREINLLGIVIKTNEIIQDRIIRRLGDYKIIFQPHKDVSCYIFLRIISKN